MKTLTNEQQMQILQECVNENECSALVRQYLHLVRNTVSKVYRSKAIPFTSEDLEDRVQDVFEVLFKYNKQKLRQYDPKHGLKVDGWIRLITTQTVLDSFKGRQDFIKKNDGFRIPLEDLEMMTGGKYAGTDTETACILSDATEKLPPNEKLVLKLEYKKGLAPEEIGRCMGKTANNIYQIKKRAIENLKKIMCL
ncbi:MAG: sigma-70 family RNA polymerase sigma factor [Desulfococcaceae bacterium]